VLVTWNWYISLLGTLNIAIIMLSFLGLWPLLEWELDIYNVIFLIISVGLSVDYTVHLLHAYNESMGDDRETRTQHTVSSMGITVLSGATTTLLSAVPLFICQATVFKRLGTFMFIIIFLSITSAITLLVPLLLTVGPNGEFGDVQFFMWLRRNCVGKTRALEVSPADVSDVQEIGKSH